MVGQPKMRCEHMLGWLPLHKPQCKIEYLESNDGHRVVEDPLWVSMAAAVDVLMHEQAAGGGGGSEWPAHVQINVYSVIYRERCTNTHIYIYIYYGCLFLGAYFLD